MEGEEKTIGLAWGFQASHRKITRQVERERIEKKSIEFLGKISIFG